MGRLGVSHIRHVHIRGLAMWVCDNCGAMFDEPELEHDTYENYCGVGGMFSNSHDLLLEVCPSCGSEDIASYCEDEDETEGAIWTD